MELGAWLLSAFGFVFLARVYVLTRDRARLNEYPGVVGPSLGEQLVGEKCVACTKRLMLVHDGFRCHECHEVIHDRCEKLHDRSHRVRTHPYR